MLVSIRPENKQDYKTITMVNDMAFGQENEGQLIEKLRKNKKFVKNLSLVACMGNEIVGHILFFPIQIQTDETSIETLALAPVSVIPELQGLEIGSELIKKGLAKARKLKYQSVVVLGHENYYPKFGFRKANTFNIECSFDVPEENFMLLELEKESLKNICGKVIYPAEYMDV